MTVLTAIEYGILAVVVTVIVALAPAASEVKVQVNTPAEGARQAPPVPPEIEEDTYVTSAGMVSTTEMPVTTAVLAFVTVIV
jgi:hypothetical protein